MGQVRLDAELKLTIGFVILADMNTSSRRKKMNNKLFNFLSLLFMYAIGLFTGSMAGKYWILPFLWTGIWSCVLLITFETLRRNNRCQ